MFHENVVVVVAAAAAAAVIMSAAATENVDSIHRFKNACVQTKFKSAECRPDVVYKRVRDVVDAGFDFRRADHIKLYTQTLVLLNNLNYYSPYKTDVFIGMMAANCRLLSSLVAANSTLTLDMQRESSELFRWTSDSLVRYHSFDPNVFLRTFVDFQNFYNTFVLWNNRDTYILGILLLHYQRLRGRFVATVPNEKNLVVERIDVAAAQMVRIAIEYPLFAVDTKFIKETAYVVYVSKMETSTAEATAATAALFDGLYSNVTKMEVMVNLFNVTIADGNLTYNVHHSRNVAGAGVDLMKSEIKAVYGRFVKAYSFLGERRYGPNGRKHVDVFVHATKEQYKRYGPMWSIPTNNGGYTFMDRSTGRIQMHVYYDERAVLPRNFGHETFHTIMYAIDDDEIESMPDWYVEGAANAYGHEDCFDEDQTFMKQNVRSVKIREIVEATYDSDILYPMGHALVRFLRDQRRSTLRRMIESRDYGISIRDGLEMQTRFEHFVLDRVEFCDYKIRQRHELINRERLENVQRRYLEDLGNGASLPSVFDDTLCPDYVLVEFEDCFFLMTPKILIKVLRPHYNSPMIDVDEELLRYRSDNRSYSVSRYDFDWFKKGAIKYGFKVAAAANAHMTDSIESIDTIVAKYLMSNMIYDYRTITVTCRYGNGSDALIRYAAKTKEYASIVAAVSKDENEDGAGGGVKDFQMIVNSLMETLKACRIMMMPVVVSRLDVNTTVYRIAKNISVGARITFWADDESQLVTPIDERGDTLMHWAALHDTILYEYSVNWFGEAKVARVKNSDGRTASELHKHRVAYNDRFGLRIGGRYCFTFLPINSSISDAFNITSTTPTISTSTTNTPTTSTTSTTGYYYNITAAATPNTTFGINENKSFHKNFIFLYIIGTLLLLLFSFTIGLCLIMYKVKTTSTITTVLYNKVNNK
ncbi:hypothetical protein SlsnVgp113 [Spodoptera littoralis nucleopolyhedrovirus]|uniref:Uncharacterized protein n=1 Tax=Spodoptera littoralis nuclear polyhedrosis virus TaxID=10456 RepID=M1JNZ6_NPVSL|nr:hypothetical protein SlsnVgp113 [Spodoptera littoralis nucleopolyhedrovirus]AGE89968.1 hypothetical protein SlsnVgp113 [Spodoptera littoralis nucleopolyhedrovirus]